MEERGKIDIPNTQIYDRSFIWLGTDTSIRNGGVMVVLWEAYFSHAPCH